MVNHSISLFELTPEPMNDDSDWIEKLLKEAGVENVTMTPRMWAVFSTSQLPLQQWGQTVFLTKHFDQIPRHLQEMLNDLTIPIPEVVQAVYDYAELHPNDMWNSLFPVLKDLSLSYKST